MDTVVDNYITKNLSMKQLNYFCRASPLRTVSDRTNALSGRRLIRYQSVPYLQRNGIRGLLLHLLCKW
jgi:hypothetical protein